MARCRESFGVLGITRLADVTGLDFVGLPVVAAVRPNARSLAVQQGKGLSMAAACTSAAMEAVERFSAEHPVLPLPVESYAALAENCSVLDWRCLPRRSGVLFDDHTDIEWAEGFDLQSGASIWLPAEAVHADYALPLHIGWGIFQATTTGLAAGSNYVEALLHGLCEVVERDALTLFAFSSKTRRDNRRVDVRTIDSAEVLECIERIDRCGLQVELWDITSDLGVPCFYASIAEFDRPAPGAVLRECGSGCHPFRDVAALRALTEAAQSRLTLISGTRDSLSRWDYGPRPIDKSSRGCSQRRDFTQVPECEHDDLAATFDWLVRELGEFKPIVVDLTHPQVGIPVVRAVVPGLEDGVGTPDYLPGPRALALRLARMLEESDV